MNHFKHAVVCALTVGAVLLAPAGRAQTFPSKPIRILNEFSAGAGGDIITRVIASKLAEIVQQPVIIENRPGAGGALAGRMVAQSAPDGYTLLASTPNSQVLRIVLVKDTSSNPYNPQKDLTPIMMIGETPIVVLARTDGRLKSFKDLIELARRNPGTLSVGHSGFGTTFHLDGEQVKLLTGVTWLDVPYKGGLPATQDVATGQIDISLAIVGSAMPLLSAGRVRPIAVMAASRLAAMPDVLTVSELLPDFRPVPNWIGIFGPANMPQPILERLHADLVKATIAPDSRAKIIDGGMTVVANSPAEFAALIRNDVELVGRIVKAANIQITEGQ